MLEIRDLVKVYKTKGGAEVRALDGVSVKFEERGMVFLLGKSGSGKSTLLNLCGGLDAPDSGEIIIKGRSSKDFSQSDFDSYRNTFLGFIFQEYNILDEFSVEDNIALALELQGKNRNKEAINAILEQVDLSAFAKRKPNTLSGGQKQRVAIARALVKNPEIIMADEPTGALDSNTGKQVFDTLKKLSESKLVIVVSHDREFAEIYGDRIIELKDGKIISDVSKTKIAAVSKSENVQFVGEDTISIKKGAALSADDLKTINAFLAKAPEDVIITSGKQEITNFRKAARIDENGARETFRDTDQSSYAAKVYSPQESKFIRSKLPLRHAVRIGASSMKVKPIRLMFTILLTIIAFTLFGLFSTLTFYDRTSTVSQSYIDSGYTHLMMQKKFQETSIYYSNGEEQSRYSSLYNTRYSPAELNGLRTRHDANALGLFSFSSEKYSSNNYDGDFLISNARSSSSYNSDYYSYRIAGFANAGESWQGEMLAGDATPSTLGKDEVIITSYTFESLKNAQLTDTSDKPVTLSTPNDILGKQLVVQHNYTSSVLPLTVRGVYRCDLPQKYDSYKDAAEFPQDSDEKRDFQMDRFYSACQYLIVNDSFYDDYKALFSSGNSEYVDYGFSHLNSSIMYELTSPVASNSGDAYQINSLPVQHGAMPDLHFFDGRTQPSLSGKEIVPSLTRLYDYFYQVAEDYRQTQFNKIDSEPMSDEDKIAAHQALDEECSAFTTAISELAYPSDMTTEETQAAIQCISTFCNTHADLFTALDSITIRTQENQDLGTFEIVGFYYGAAAYQESGGIYFSGEQFDAVYRVAGMQHQQNDSYSETITKYKTPADAMYNYIYLAYGNAETLRSIVAMENVVNEDDSSMALCSVIGTRMMMIDMLTETLVQVFLYVGIVLAVFSMLLLFNFISVSISNKRKEIGILRAVGARSTDVFKIFYSESIIISAICFAVGMVLSFVICGVLNNTLGGTLGISLFVFGPLSWLVMLGIAVLSSFLATFLPVYNAAKRKPVESIRAL